MVFESQKFLWFVNCAAMQGRPRRWAGFRGGAR